MSATKTPHPAVTSFDADRGPWLETASGRRFFLLTPSPMDVAIEDIAHALARQCRFAGHVTVPHYSVAQHSVLVSQHVPAELALDGLLHDAVEAYVQDLPSPVKWAMRRIDAGLEEHTAYDEVEERVARAVALRFGIAFPTPRSVKDADMRALFTERRDVRLPSSHLWEDQDAYPPFLELIRAWGAEEAQERFLERFAEIGGAR